jgi:hypothetical protein
MKHAEAERNLDESTSAEEAKEKTKRVGPLFLFVGVSARGAPLAH